MNSEVIKKLKAIKISDYIFVIFIIIALVGMYANHKERDAYTGLDSKGIEKAHNIRMVLLVVSLLIYIYFLETRIKDRESATNKFISNLDVLASILFVIGGIIFLYDEYKGESNPIIIE